MKNIIILTLGAILFLTACASPGVIGVGYNKKGVVKYIYKESPAEKAGIMLEDIILNPKKLRGPIGSICHVEFKRDNVLMKKDIERVDVDSLKGESYGTW